MPTRSCVAQKLLCCSIAASAGVLLAACGSSAGGKLKAASAHASNGRALVAERSDSTSTAGRCVPAHKPAPRGAQRIPKPTLKLDPAKTYVVTLITNCGTISVHLDVREAPATTASFAYLVKRGFYNDLTFHRVAAGFVIQGGDPNGDGSGGPGYTVVEPPPSDVRYTLGTVAMAKTSSDPSGASGSQFFIVTTANASLPPEYALVGNVVGSLTGVEAISRLPTNPPEDGAPIKPVVIRDASLSSN